MARQAAWHDVSKTSKAGLASIEFRLRLPKGDVILKKLPSVPFDPTLQASDLWSVKCLAMHLQDTPFKATSPEKAQKQALAIVNDHIKDLGDVIVTCSEAIARIQSAKPARKEAPSNE